MITTPVEYEKAQAELRDLRDRLDQLQRDYPLGENGFTKAGIRKLIARLNEELAVFEGSEQARSAVKHTIREQLERQERNRLHRECEKLDPRQEQQLAEEGMPLEAQQWPGY